MTDTRVQPEPLFTAAEVAQRLQCAQATVRRRTFQLGLGVRLGGRAGNRYSEADVQALLQSMRAEPPVERRRRRSA